MGHIHLIHCVLTNGSVFSYLQGKFNDFVRRLILRHVPRWFSLMVNDRLSYDRPQLEFLPFVEIEGSLKPKEQTRSAYVPKVPQDPKTNGQTLFP